jgi:4-amino-4-deoxy-L-arabinose transferase-like glycosyltransferase
MVRRHDSSGSGVSHVTGRLSGKPRWLLRWYTLAIVLAVFTYLYGLDSQHIPKNGDEYPYENIARTTAASGRWLPLQSELPEMRNTKPPLLFWQGIVSTDWGRRWTLWNLRWPSVVYTLLTAGMALLVAWRLSGQLETGLVAALTFLAFFSTYRYGRPFLTDSPSVFWLFLPCFVLLWRPAAIESRTIAPFLLGLATGVGLLYKSFALLLPVGLFLAWWHLHQRRYVAGPFFARDAGKLVVLGVVALATFGLWFLLDPDPRAILNEFVLKENAGKFGAPGDYLKNLFWGASSIWRVIVSFPLNAGLLMFPVISLGIVAFKRRAELSDGERALWMWLITLFVVFSLPSQRDERYLLPGMPALAVLCALNWERISTRAFNASLITTGAGLLMLAYLSLRLDQGVTGDALYRAGYWALLTATATVILAALLVPRLARACVNVAILMAFLNFAAFLRPFDGPPGIYNTHVQQAMKGRTVWVPINFAAREEVHRFLLPGADIRAYPFNPNLTAEELAAHYPLFAIRLPLNRPDTTTGTVIGQRLDIATRQTPEQIVDMLRGNVFEHLFVRELLVEAGGAHQR